MVVRERMKIAILRKRSELLARPVKMTGKGGEASSRRMTTSPRPGSVVEVVKKSAQASTRIPMLFSSGRTNQTGTPACMGEISKIKITENETYHEKFLGDDEIVRQGTDHIVSEILLPR